jgi:hypothetical protein
MDEKRAVKILLDQPEIIINRQAVRMKTEVIPTSNGMRFILLVGETTINLSWLHSIQELEPGKILLLYYDLKGLGEKKPKI